MELPLPARCALIWRLSVALNVIYMVSGLIRPTEFLTSAGSAQFHLDEEKVEIVVVDDIVLDPGLAKIGHAGFEISNSLALFIL